MSEKLDLPIRPRRNRKTPAIRGLVRETVLTPADLIYPLFLHEDAEDTDIRKLRVSEDDIDVPGFLKE